MPAPTTSPKAMPPTGPSPNSVRLRRTSPTGSRRFWPDREASPTPRDPYPFDELVLKYPFYGARQMVRHLRREGVCIGRGRARRLMRLLGLQAVYRAPRTSAPHPEHRGWPYLLKDLRIERSNHVWCAAASCSWRRSWTGRAATSWPGG